MLFDLTHTIEDTTGGGLTQLSHTFDAMDGVVQALDYKCTVALEAANRTSALSEPVSITTLAVMG